MFNTPSSHLLSNKLKRFWSDLQKLNNANFSCAARQHENALWNTCLSRNLTFYSKYRVLLSPEWISCSGAGKPFARLEIICTSQIYEQVRVPPKSVTVAETGLVNCFSIHLIHLGVEELGTFVAVKLHQGNTFTMLALNSLAFRNWKQVTVTAVADLLFAFHELVNSKFREWRVSAHFKASKPEQLHCSSGKFGSVWIDMHSTAR